MEAKTRARLEIVIGYADRIAQTLERAGDIDGFISDYDLQYSTAHSISQIAETLTQVLQSNPEYSESLLRSIPYRDIKRMRDKIQHHYGTIDPDMVWAIASKNVPQLRESIQSLLT